MYSQDPFEISARDSTYLTGTFVGGYVPRQTANHLRLLSIYKSTTLQSILQEMVEEWIVSQEPYVSIIEILADRAHMEWLRRASQNEDWSTYEQELRERLKRRKVNNESVEEILKEVKKKIGKKD